MSGCSLRLTRRRSESDLPHRRFLFVPAPDRTGAERWVSIWVRTAFDTTSYLTSDSERTACVRISRGCGGDRSVYGTVLPWHGDQRRHPVVGAAAFISALNEQECDWMRIRDADPKAPLVVAGGFNQNLLGRGLTERERSAQGATSGRLPPHRRFPCPCLQQVIPLVSGLWSCAPPSRAPVAGNQLSPAQRPPPSAAGGTNIATATSTAR